MARSHHLGHGVRRSNAWMDERASVGVLEDDQLARNLRMRRLLASEPYLRQLDGHADNHSP